MAKRGRPKKESTVDIARWTILIPWETKTAVTKAAQRAQSKLNEWIDKALIKASREVLTGKQEIAKPEDVADIIRDMSEKLDKLTEEVNKPFLKKLFRK